VAVHIYTQTIHRTTQITIEQHKYNLTWKSVGRVPLCEFYPGICLTGEEKSRKNLSQSTVYVQRNPGTRSCNHYGGGQAIFYVRHILSGWWVFLSLRIQRAMRMRHFVMCGLPGSTICFHRTLRKVRFSKKKVTEQKMCVLIFYTNFVLNISHSKKKWARYDRESVLVFM